MIPGSHIFCPGRSHFFLKLPCPIQVALDFLWWIGSACPPSLNGFLPLLGTRRQPKVRRECVIPNSDIFCPGRSHSFPNCPYPSKGPMTFCGGSGPLVLPLWAAFFRYFSFGSSQKQLSICDTKLTCFLPKKIPLFPDLPSPAQGTHNFLWRIKTAFPPSLSSFFRCLKLGSNEGLIRGTWYQTYFS